MSDSLRIALAQLNFLVGDVQGNAARVIATARSAAAESGADLVLFPELALSGYPPEDLLFHRGFRRQVEAGLERVRAEVTDVPVMLGFPEYTASGIYNSAALIAGGEIAAIPNLPGTTAMMPPPTPLLAGRPVLYSHLPASS